MALLSPNALRAIEAPGDPQSPRPEKILEEEVKQTTVLPGLAAALTPLCHDYQPWG